MEKKFDQNKYTNQWKKENMQKVSAEYKKDFVKEFKEACDKLDIAQSQVIRKAMQETIMEAKNLSKK